MKNKPEQSSQKSILAFFGALGMLASAAVAADTTQPSVRSADRAKAVIHNAKGKVVAGPGVVLPGALIDLKSRNGDRYFAHSDKDGVVQIPSIAPGVYTVAICYENNNIFFEKGVAIDSATIAPWVLAENILSGTIRNGKGKPVANVRLCLKTDDIAIPESHKLLFNGVSRADGTYEFRFVKPGIYNLFAVGSGDEGAVIVQRLEVSAKTKTTVRDVNLDNDH